MLFYQIYIVIRNRLGHMILNPKHKGTNNACFINVFQRIIFWVTYERCAGAISRLFTTFPPRQKSLRGDLPGAKELVLAQK